jgi:hypothetical protein
MKDFLRERGLILGQVGGYSAGAMTFLGAAKDFFGLIGIICGATLSAWALWDRIDRARKARAEQHQPKA